MHSQRSPFNLKGNIQTLLGGFAKSNYCVHLTFNCDLSIDITTWMQSLMPITCLCNRNLRVGEVTIYYLVSNPAIRSLRIVYAIPADMPGRIFAGINKKLSPIFQQVIPTINPNAILVRTTTDVQIFKKSCKINKHKPRE